MSEEEEIKFKFTNSNLWEAMKEWRKNPEKTASKYGHISDWDVSKITSLLSLFVDTKNFNEDISRWDVSSVVDMNSTFHNSVNFKSDISNWDVTGVKDMSFTFYQCHNFNSDISKWNVSKVRDMFAIFLSDESKQTSLFKGNISKWDVSGISREYSIFTDAFGLEHIKREIAKSRIRDFTKYVWRICRVTPYIRVFQRSFKERFYSPDDGTFTTDVGGPRFHRLQIDAP